VGEQRMMEKKKPSGIGTGVMKKGSGGGQGGKKEDGEWGDW
jgi:ADP-ribosylation factor GTPase-activating protein 1